MLWVQAFPDSCDADDGEQCVEGIAEKDVQFGAAGEQKRAVNIAKQPIDECFPTVVAGQTLVFLFVKRI